MKKALLLLSGALLSVIVMAAPSSAPDAEPKQDGPFRIYPTYVQDLIDANANLVGRINPFGTVCLEAGHRGSASTRVPTPSISAVLNLIKARFLCLLIGELTPVKLNF